MAEQWALLHIDQLMPHPPVPPKALGCLSLRGTPWSSFTVSPGDPQAKGKRTLTFSIAFLSLIPWPSP